jgi:hypothetical protein
VPESADNDVEMSTWSTNSSVGKGADQATLSWLNSQPVDTAITPGANVGYLAQDVTGTVGYICLRNEREVNIFFSQMLDLGYGLYVLKDDWRQVAAIPDVQHYIKRLLRLIFTSAGEQMKNFSLTGRRGAHSKEGQATHKRALPTEVLDILKGVENYIIRFNFTTIKSIYFRIPPAEAMYQDKRRISAPLLPAGL